MEAPRLSLPGWVQEIHNKLDRIQSLIDSREALGAAQESVKRIREGRRLLILENNRLREELKAVKAEVVQLEQVIIKKLGG